MAFPPYAEFLDVVFVYAHPEALWLDDAGLVYLDTAMVSPVPLLRDYIPIKPSQRNAAAMLSTWLAAAAALRDVYGERSTVFWIMRSKHIAKEQRLLLAMQGYGSAPDTLPRNSLPLVPLLEARKKGRAHLVSNIVPADDATGDTHFGTVLETDIRSAMGAKGGTGYAVVLG